MNRPLPKVPPMSDAEKPKLRQANDNPWYCLATLHGEQAKGARVWEDLAAKNRLAWNRWIAGALTDKQRADLVGKGIPEIGARTAHS